MENDERRRSAPMHIGVRMLWSVIIGYGLVALPAALLVNASSAQFFGVFGAVTALASTLHRHSRERGRTRPTADRPHSGWIG